MHQPNKIMLDQWLPVLQQWFPCNLAVTSGAHLPLALLQDCPYVRLSAVHLAEHDGSANFYKVSLPAESGLLAAEDLRACWPNLKTVSTQTVQVQCLDNALEQYIQGQGEDSYTPNWLWLGCLPATPVLRGAFHTLVNVDVVLARVVVAEGAPLGADLPSLQSHLEDKGFQLVGIQIERNPALATALFVKNYKSIFHDIRAELTQNQQTQQDLLARLNTESEARAQVQHQCDELAHAQAHLLQQLEQTSKIREDLETKLIQYKQSEKKQQDVELKCENQVERENSFGGKLNVGNDLEMGFSWRRCMREATPKLIGKGYEASIFSVGPYVAKVYTEEYFFYNKEYKRRAESDFLQSVHSNFFADVLYADQFYMVMPNYGKKIGQYTKIESGEIDADKLVVWLSDLKNELKRLQVAHRDINPSNILFNQHTSEYRLIDFSWALQGGELERIEFKPAGMNPYGLSDEQAIDNMIEEVKNKSK